MKKQFLKIPFRPTGVFFQETCVQKAFITSAKKLFNKALVTSNYIICLNFHCFSFNCLEVVLNYDEKIADYMHLTISRQFVIQA